MGVRLVREVAFKIQMSRRLSKRTLWSIFAKIEELQTYRDPETGKMEGYHGIPTNYGSICFHPLFDVENLEAYYPFFTSEEELGEIEKKKADPTFNLFNYLVDDGFIYDGGPLPDILGFIQGYNVQVSLSMIGFAQEYAGDLDEDVKKAEWQLERLRLLKRLADNPDDLGFIDFEYTWEFMEFDDNDETEEYGYSLALTLDLNSEMTVEDVEKEIDQKIAFLKPYIKRMSRTDELFPR